MWKSPTNASKMNKYTIILISLLLLLSATFVGGIFTHKAWVRDHTVPPDTVTVFRTEYIDRPRPVESVPAPDTIPSVTVNKKDITPSADSSAVDIRPSVTTYRDTLPSGASYDVTVSGVGTVLENISLSWPQRETVRTVPFRGWSIDLVGRGLISDFSMEGLAAFAGIEVGYTSNRFSIGAGPGVLYDRPPGAASHKAHLAVCVSMKFRLASFKR